MLKLTVSLYDKSGSFTDALSNNGIAFQKRIPRSGMVVNSGSVIEIITKFFTIDRFYCNELLNRTHVQKNNILSGKNGLYE